MKYLKKIFEDTSDNQKLKEEIEFYFSDFFDFKDKNDFSQIIVDEENIEIDIKFPINSCLEFSPSLWEHWDQDNNSFNYNDVEKKLDDIKNKQLYFYEHFMTAVKRLKENYPNIKIKFYLDWVENDEPYMMCDIERESLK